MEAGQNLEAFHGNGHLKGRTNDFAAWLGLLAIVLHALVPLAGMAAYGPPATASAHEHAGHSHGTDHGVHGAPAAPQEICLGDCPCCTTNYKTFIPSRTDFGWPRSTLSNRITPTEDLAAVQISELSHDHPARAPPAHA
jgi:hypothetical protein